MTHFSVCQTKVHFDTEFEADRAAAITGHHFGEEMISYKCHNHYHITHKDSDLRRGVGHKYDLCVDCGEIMKRGKLKKHKCQKEEL